MEGCLYKYNDKYYYINNIASHNMLALEFGTFKSCFIKKDNDNYEIIDFNPDNIQQLLDDYDEFKNYINYSNLKDFNQIDYNERNYYIRSWLDVFNFAAGRF